MKQMCSKCGRRKGCNTMDRTRDMACKDFRKKEKTKDV